MLRALVYTLRFKRNTPYDGRSMSKDKYFVNPPFNKKPSDIETQVAGSNNADTQTHHSVISWMPHKNWIWNLEKP